MNKKQRTKNNQSIILRLLKQRRLTKESVDRLKREIAGLAKLPPPPTADLLLAYRQLLASGKIKPKRTLESLLKKRAVRSLSGVAIVTVLTKPWPCPGRCVYCPQEAGMPKSYLKNEPAAQRAYLNKFNPYRQVFSRLQMLYNNGHPIDKIELIVKGGSWNAYPWRYQVWFIAECFRAANDFSLKHLNIETIKQLNNLTIKSKLLNCLMVKLSAEQRGNETARHRIVGLTLETRPDLITSDEIKKMRLLGCTRVELGAQHTDNKILKKVKRGHNLQQTKAATKLLKNAGFKVDYHLMPQLPGSSPKKDYEMFKTVFADPDLRPDMIKIYPCAVVKGSELYYWHKQKKYRPYSGRRLIELLIKVKSKLIPRYCRISRLIRDIPATEIIAGNRVTNLREVIKEQMRQRGLVCPCLRCREIGHQDAETFKHLNNKHFFVEKYEASGGTEYFLSFEDRQRRVVYAFCRLRISEKGAVPSLRRACPELAEGRGEGWLYPAYLRELHTYGQLVPLKHLNIQTFKQGKEVQHQGLGKRLVAEAEKIAREQGAKKMAVIAGVGVREYYRRLGYRLENTYMIKKFPSRSLSRPKSRRKVGVPIRASERRERRG